MLGSHSAQIWPRSTPLPACVQLTGYRGLQRENVVIEGGVTGGFTVCMTSYVQSGWGWGGSRGAKVGVEGQK